MCLAHITYMIWPYMSTLQEGIYCYICWPTAFSCQILRVLPWLWNTEEICLTQWHTLPRKDHIQWPIEVETLDSTILAQHGITLIGLIHSRTPQGFSWGFGGPGSYFNSFFQILLSLPLLTQRLKLNKYSIHQTPSQLLFPENFTFST